MSWHRYVRKFKFTYASLRKKMKYTHMQKRAWVTKSKLKHCYPLPLDTLHNAYVSRCQRQNRQTAWHTYKAFTYSYIHIYVHMYIRVCTYNLLLQFYKNTLTLYIALAHAKLYMRLGLFLPLC